MLENDTTKRYARGFENFEEASRRTGFPVVVLETFAERGLITPHGDTLNVSTLLRSVEEIQRGR